MNLPNKLTVGRLFLTALFVVFMSTSFPGAFFWALGVFLLAGITDWLDGHLARKLNLVTSFGKLMDPLADKVLVCAAFVLLAVEGLVPGWIVVVILTREFLVTGLRLLASAEGRIVAADRLGKIKTILQMATVIFLLGRLAIGDRYAEIPNAHGGAADVPGLIFLAVTTAVTAVSGISYCWKNKELIQAR